MTHIWIRENFQWAVLPLGGAPFYMNAGVPIDQARGANLTGENKITLMPTTAHSGESWILLAGTNVDVRVNGIPLNLGIRVLRDCDEIRIPGTGLFYFSTERLARIEPFRGSAPNPFCPRCRQKIDENQPSVKCPACNVWYHQSDDFPCWTYSETCALCPQPTGMDDGYRWVPEEI